MAENNGKDYNDKVDELYALIQSKKRAMIRKYGNQVKSQWKRG